MKLYILGTRSLRVHGRGRLGCGLSERAVAPDGARERGRVEAGAVLRVPAVTLCGWRCVGGGGWRPRPLETSERTARVHGHRCAGPFGHQSRCFARSDSLKTWLPAPRIRVQQRPVPVRSHAGAALWRVSLPHPRIDTCALRRVGDTHQMPLRNSDLRSGTDRNSHPRATS